MPPEPLPWDRKEFFRDRKHGHDRSEPFGPGLGSRWRDSSSSYGGGGGGGGGLHRNNSMDFSPRWGYPSDFRRPLGHGKQGGWHMYHDDYPSTRSSDRFLDTDGFRPAIPRGDGRYGRFYRENRSSYGQKEWRHHWEPNHHRNTLSNTPNRPRFVTEPRSVGESPTRASNPTHSDQSHHSHSKDQADNNTNDANGSSTCPKLEKEDSVRPREWKPLKWSRSSGSKSNGGGESNDTKADSSLKKVSPLRSASDNAVADIPCVVPYEETSSRKKPRLGWGEGLAKYEKKKVEVPEENVIKVVANVDSLGVERTNTPTSFCSSPATPSSFACSSSPGLDDKAFTKTTDADTNNCSSVSSMPSSENQLEESHFKLEKLQLDSISDLSSLLNELLQASEQYPADSAFVKSSALNKLLLLKGDISKELESTETLIDSLENELKSLNSVSGIDSFLVDCKDGPLPLEVVEGNKDSEIDSPGTATSKFSEPHLMNCAPKCTDLAISTIGATRNFDMRSDVEKNADKQDNICDVIINSNKEFAARAFEELCKVSPSYDSSCGNSLEGNRERCDGGDSVIREKFMKRKKSVKFKEKVMALKYRAFQHMWKEELRLLSLKSQRVKVQKRMLHSGGIQKKHRLSVRSRFSSPAGNISQVPTADIITYTAKLLSQSPPKVYRSSLKMPAMILDDKEKTISRFVSSNGFVEDPCAIEKERMLNNPWTLEEKEIFLKQLAIYGKDFSKIASFLDHKTTADCIQFYYKNHKSDWFVKTKKNKPEILRQGKAVTKNPYLVTPGNRWSREMNAVASLDILGAASVMAARADEAMRPLTAKKRKVSETVFEPSKGNLVDEDERETVAADVLAGICGSLSSVGSCITSAVEPQKVGPSNRGPLTPEVTQNVDDGADTCSSDEGEMGPMDWTDDEKCLFVEAFSSFGRDFVAISRFVRSKSRDQCKVFFSKARKCLSLDSLRPVTGGSDGEDAPGIVENGSVICSDKSGSRGEDVSKPEALSTEVESTKQSTAVGDGVVRVEDVAKSGDDTCRVQDPLVNEDDDTSRVGCSSGGIDNSQHSFPSLSSLKSSSHLDSPTKVETGIRSFQNCYMRKCNQPTSQNVVGELPFLSKSEARSDIHKPTRNGDVKLFGKILRKPSSIDEPKMNIPSARESGNRFNMNIPLDHDVDDHDSFAGLENVPIRSYGFWDGTKIQTGFPSLPDSALLLAKYSSAFSSYPATVNVDECNLNGACVFSPREFGNSNGNMADHRVDPDREKVQPFSLDLEPGRETRNGFDGVSGIGRQGKGLVKLNVVQGGDMLVGGSCASVSDAVATLKLHYVGAEPYGGGGGGGGGGSGIVREERR